MARAMAVTISARAVVMPAAQAAASHPARVAGPPPNHNPAPSVARTATVAVLAQIHLVLVMHLIVAR